METESDCVSISRKYIEARSCIKCHGEALWPRDKFQWNMFRPRPLARNLHRLAGKSLSRISLCICVCGQTARELVAGPHPFE